MTSETETLKTNEFQRRRKLRLQQVREQSKDIAKKIRQRAKDEKLKQVVNLDISKQKQYFKKQEELVKQLEVLYSKGIANVGSSHRSASEVRKDQIPEKLDLSKIRAREAAAELRKQKQDKLDEQKRLLDRKLQAREIANELSRDKSNKTLKKPLEAQNNAMEEPSKDTTQVDPPNDKPMRSDMATQWELEEPANEEPSIPTLALQDTPTEINNNQQKSDHSKRLDLFALSEGMPLSLRGQLVSEERVPVKESVNIVSEFLRNRSMRLRETDTNTNINKKQAADDLLGVKETILRTRSSRTEGKNTNNDRLIKTSAPDSSAKRNTITMYNHSTRDARNVLAPNNDEQYVVRNHQTEEDAYVKAMRESNVENTNKDKAQTRMDNMRNKVAMTKETVEKEYKETMNFLKSLPKDTNRPVRNSHMDDHRQQLQQDRRQHKMQCEFRNIQRECSKHKNRNERSKSKSPVSNFESGDFQYSWMPVPDSDNNLAIHTIPTSVREGKAGNTVKFSKVDSYHEYRSRHKHTPPTKDTCKEKQAAKRIEAMIVDNDVTDNSSTTSDVSSSENIRLTAKKTKPRKDSEISDTDRIIIYKILDSKSDKSCKKTAQLLTEIKESLSSRVSRKYSDSIKADETEKETSLGKIDEGIYKAVNEKGLYQIEKFYATNVDLWYSEIEQSYCWNSQKAPGRPIENQQCQCNKTLNNMQRDKGTTSDWDICDSSNRPSKTCTICKCGCSKSNTRNVSPPPPQPSAATSTTSFKSATNVTNNVSPDTGFIKLVDDGGQEAGKFYIGASGFMKNDNYEVVIQLRKKQDDNKSEDKTESVDITKPSIPVVVEDEEPSEAEANVTEQDSENKLHATKKDSHIIDNKDEEIRTVADRPFSFELNTEPCQNKNADLPQDLFCDKGVETSFKLSYVMPSDAPKIDAIHRPGTSTYTQTSFSSPNQRPVFLHMSSSTSTAYMSPPELILPRFLKKSKSKEKHRETCRVQSRERVVHSNRKFNEEYDCDCKRCHHVNTISVQKSKDPICYKKCSKHKQVSSHTSSCLSSQRFKRSETKIPCAAKHKLNKLKSQGPGCTSKVRNKIGLQDVSKKPLQSVYNLRHQDRPVFTQTNLNPVVESYISKLLTLNKEGLRAVEVANQECSSVATPGSSIVNEPNNISGTKSAETQISLEQIKLMIKQQIFEEYSKNKSNDRNAGDFDRNHVKQKPQLPQTRKKVVHKVKSFNISKNLRSKATRVTQVTADNLGTSTSSSNKDETETSNHHTCKNRSKSSPTPRQTSTKSTINPSDVNIRKKNNVEKLFKDGEKVTKAPVTTNTKCLATNKLYNTTSNQSISNTEHSDWMPNTLKQKCEIPMTTGTQTVSEDLKYVKVAVDKLQNMEKIADLTEKCTMRLSNLAKVLEEVRKNKSLVYSQISSSDTTSGSENKNERRLHSKTPPYTQSDDDNEIKNNQPCLEIKSGSSKDTSISSSEYIPFLTDIPKPPKTTLETGISPPSVSPVMKSPVNINSPPSPNVEGNIKTRGKPPPALSRIHLKHGNDHIIPHELSTVLEVDSPMSLKLKNQSNNKGDTLVGPVTENDESKQEISNNPQSKETFIDPDLLKSNLRVPNHKIKTSQNNQAKNDSKIQMMDLKQFNEIMLKPFITFQEHAKQCNVLLGDSNTEKIPKELVIDEISSLHSDGSLPDVIAELLKRNVISEPFKYDTVSNINSTSMSSESTLSVLALSKTKKDKKKTNVVFNTKEHKAETSDSMSISSNPDLERAFKNLGMGWASSTLKKTKERLALSSSSNTSSSSLSQFKIKNQEIPALVSDSVSSIINSSKNTKQKNVAEQLKNVGQQTSQSTSMTVKDFLKNELANKITFTNKSYKDDSEEFVSLFETKMPENMKNDSMCEHPSMDSIPSGNNRARTSTPVQVYKSMTYQSSTTSNMSNGLFSNADDLSSVKGTSHSMKNHSTSEKDDLLIPKLSLRTKLSSSGSSKSD